VNSELFGAGVFDDGDEDGGELVGFVYQGGKFTF
jgi:hypothetical protein